MIFPLVTVDSLLWPADSVARVIPDTQIPDPYRQLLAHTDHMTVTVEQFYAQSVDVRVLDSGLSDEFYHRRIVLELQQSHQVVQFGAVRINLECCAPKVRAAILEQQTPLGRILIENDVLRRIEPTSFLEIKAGPTLAKMMNLTTPSSLLYGRTGVIFFDNRPAIAVLEILSPIPSSELSTLF